MRGIFQRKLIGLMLIQVVPRSFGAGQSAGMLPVSYTHLDVYKRPEAVLRLHIKRYFDITRQMKKEKVQRRRIQNRFVVFACGSCLLLSALLLALTFFT